MSHWMIYAVVLVAALLTPFSIPEIAYLSILLPTEYLGLVAASYYIMARDLICNYVYQQQWGGQFEIPEYQVSEGLTRTFGDKAEKVRHYYVEEIKTCFQKEEQYKALPKLTGNDKQKRQANIQRTETLLCEWYDIHSNPDHTIEASRNTVLNRLEKDGFTALNTLKDKMPQEIPVFTHQLTEQFKAYDPEKPESRHVFFQRPSCFEDRKKMNCLYELKEEIRNSPGTPS